MSDVPTVAVKNNGHSEAVARPPRILVADDQPANIQVVGSMLGKQGYEIVPAADGPTTLKRLAVRLPDLILLDVLMPGMNGLDICRKIRENPDWKDIPIIFISAADDKELIVRALEAGGVDYVTKPFNYAEMLSRVRTHLALKAARDQMKQLAEDRDELLGILAHDLKNHLGGVQMSARLLRDNLARTTSGKPLQLCENICHSTGQLLSFVKEFLANSAADHRIELKPGTINLSELVSRTVEDYREAARQKELKLELQAPEQPVLAVADSRGVAQILDNLLSNAVKFSPPGRQITVIVRETGKMAECVVKDQGRGFTDEDKTKMYRRYGRLTARPTGGEPSTGLGLSIVRKLVQAMHGQLTCESAPEQGATFTVSLPQPATTD